MEPIIQIQEGDFLVTTETSVMNIYIYEIISIGPNYLGQEQHITQIYCTIRIAVNHKTGEHYFHKYGKYANLNVLPRKIKSEIDKWITVKKKEFMIKGEWSHESFKKSGGKFNGL